MVFIGCSSYPARWPALPVQTSLAPGNHRYRHGVIASPDGVSRDLEHSSASIGRLRTGTTRRSRWVGGGAARVAATDGVSEIKPCPVRRRTVTTSGCCSQICPWTAFMPVTRRSSYQTAGRTSGSPKVVITTGADGCRVAAGARSRLPPAVRAALPAARPLASAPQVRAWRGGVPAPADLPWA